MNKMNYYELLNEYLDGELSPSEIQDMETLLAIDEDLRKKLAELKLLKQAVRKSVPPLPESPYFETRLFAELKQPVSFWNRFRKFYPVTAIGLVTIVLMVLLRYNPQLLDNIVEEQKTNLAGFYKENLQPLLFASSLTSEEIFNFAFYHQLPLNKDNNQYLLLGYDKSGNEYFEIKTASLVPDQKTLDNFIKTLNLNNSQKDKVDSILQSYAQDIQTQVLVNDKNTVAINPNIWNFNKALVADLLSFAETANKKEFDKIVPSGIQFAENIKVPQMVKQVKSHQPHQYIFITPDTVFSADYYFDKKKFAEEMNSFKEDIKRKVKEQKDYTVNIKFDTNLVRLRKIIPGTRNFQVQMVSNEARVNVPENFVPDINVPDFNKINEHIESATRHIREFSFEMSDPKSMKQNFNFKIRSENGEPIDIKINLDSLNNRIFLNKEKNGRKTSQNINIDSLFSTMKNFGRDSMSTLQRQEFDREMKQLQKEMRKFREEMMRMQRELKNQQKEIDNEPIEI